MPTSHSQIGPYIVKRELGRGGMGEIYLANDTRLDREVAIKVLPAHLSHNAEFKQRFEREARAISKLSHPNICTLYDIGQHDGVDYLVMEYLEGEPLAERLSKGPLPIDQLLRYGVEIASALDQAHRHGVVHRDLKPGNIMLTKSGAKLLDFGLAKSVTLSGSEPNAVTMTGPLTGAGTILGTFQYMAPEQLEAKEADPRTDIFAFGAVLHEMATGKRAFEGSSRASLIASIMSSQPQPIAELQPMTPPALDRLVRKCLAKDPDARWQSVSDVADELRWIAETGTVASLARVAARPGRLMWLAWALATLVVAGLAVRLAPRPAALGGPVVTKLARITRDPGRSEWPSWSPDGSFLAYASDRGGNSEIYVRRGEGGQDVNITNDPGQDVQPAFSSDGNAVAFVSTHSSRTGLIRIGGAYERGVRTYGGDLWVVPTLGGAARRLASDANYPAWRPDGKGILYVSGLESRRSIMEVPVGGGTPRAVLPSEASSWEISRLACSPDGRWISFETESEGILLMPAAGGKPGGVLMTGFGHAWDASSGRLYFIVRDPQGGSRIQFVEVSLTGQSVGSAPVTVSLMTTDLLDLAVSRDGLRIAMPELEASRNLTRLPLTPGGGAPAGPEEPLTSGRVTDSYPSVSPDSRRVAVASDTLGHMEVGVLDVDSRRRERLQLPGEDVAQGSPVWMPDGRQLLITRFHAGTRTNWIVAVDGSRAEELFADSQRGSWGINPSPDGKKLLYVNVVNGVQQIFAFDLDTRKASQLTDSPGDKFDSVFSPDGRWVAVTATKDGVIQLFRIPASGGPMQQLTTGYERMRHPFFSPDGKWIYIQPSHRNIYRVPAEGGQIEPVTQFPEAGLFLEEPTISPDGRYLYYCRENGGSSLWLMTLEEEGRRR